MWEHSNFSTSLPVVVSVYLFGHSRPSGVKWYFTGDSHQTSRAILVGLPQVVLPFLNQLPWSTLCYIDQNSVMNSILEIHSDQVGSERRIDSKFKIKVRTRIRRARCWQEAEWMSNEAQQPELVGDHAMIQFWHGGLFRADTSAVGITLAVPLALWVLLTALTSSRCAGPLSSPVLLPLCLHRAIGEVLQRPFWNSYQVDYSFLFGIS